MAEAALKEKIEPSLDGGGGDSAVQEEESGGLDAKKIVLFIVVPLFILIGAGGGLYFTGTFDKFFAKKAETEEHPAEDAHGAEKKKGEHGEELAVPGAFFLEIPDMIVNLSDEEGETRYLRLSVQLELENQGDLQAVEAVMPRVVDQFQTYLRELRVKDLRGSQGIYRLQVELLSRVNAAAAPVKVKDVLFQNILIQ